MDDKTVRAAGVQVVSPEEHVSCESRSSIIKSQCFQFIQGQMGEPDDNDMAPSRLDGR